MKKAKWFNDLPKEEQKAITKKEKAYQKEQWAIIKKSYDKQKQEAKDTLKSNAKQILKIANGDQAYFINTIFYGGPDGKVYAIYYQLTEIVTNNEGLDHLLVLCDGLYYDYQKEIVFKEAKQSEEEIKRELIPDLKNFLKSYPIKSLQILRTSPTYPEVLDYLNSLFK